MGPQIGNLVEVRGRRWIVGDVIPGGTTLVELTSVEDGRFDEKLTVAWQVETDARVPRAIPARLVWISWWRMG
ncbi:hypothetical protein ACFQ3B_06010 [Stackebrandtia endophytica]|uniref:hypothetical protein n=1 Tax=Stackebrandtia endophytica TaxID=1496996 RepID=UPI00114F6DB7|nr:hypothetical protein [Stackebrandtia endophytica]